MGTKILVGSLWWHWPLLHKVYRFRELSFTPLFDKIVKAFFVITKHVLRVHVLRWNSKSPVSLHIYSFCEVSILQEADVCNRHPLKKFVLRAERLYRERCLRKFFQMHQDKGTATVSQRLNNSVERKGHINRDGENSHVISDQWLIGVHTPTEIWKVKKKKPAFWRDKNLEG